MAEYIEREAAVRALTLHDCDSARAKMAICDIPAADVAEVRHGKWISLTECANEGVYCSVCNKKVYKADYAWSNKRIKARSNYCPNCGALMQDSDA